MFSTDQVNRIIVGNAVATETTIDTFVASATDKEIKVLSADGTNVGVGKPFKVYQKASAALGGYEFSDKINPKYVDKVTVRPYQAEVAKVVKVDGFATAGVAAANRTYEIEVRLFDQLSSENFEVIQGYYVTGAVAPTATVIRDGLLASLNGNLGRRGNREFVATANGTGIQVAEVIQVNNPGRDDGRKLGFEVIGKVYENAFAGYNSNLGLLTSTVTTQGVVGNGTGKWATNYEWFVKGFDYDSDHGMGIPADLFSRAPFYTAKDGIYNVIALKYYEPRKSTIVERQYKVLHILVQKSADTLAQNAATNAVLADLRTAIGTYTEVPANLAVV